MSKSKAVTLAELLITSAITLVILLTIYSAFNAGIFSYRNIQENFDSFLTASKILEWLNLDIRNSFIYSPEQAGFAGNKNELSCLTLVNTFNKEDLRQDYAWISYKLEDNKLMRLCRRNKDSLNEKSESAPEEMAANVAEINFNYGYQELPGGELKFDKEAWDSKTKLPLAVKVKLTLKNNKGAQDFARTIYLPAAE